MDRVVHVRILDSATRDRMAGEWQRAVSQPNWIVRVALVAFLLIVAVPLLLVVGLVALGAIIIIGGVTLLKVGVGRLRRRLRGDGRSNVRVIRRERTRV